MVPHSNSTMTSNQGASRAQLRERWSRGFDPHLGRGVLSLSKKFHPSCLVLVKTRKLSQNDRKIVDWSVKS